MNIFEMTEEERQKLRAENPPEIGGIHFGRAYFDWGWKGCGFGQLEFSVKDNKIVLRMNA